MRSVRVVSETLISQCRGLRCIKCTVMKPSKDRVQSMSTESAASLPLTEMNNPRATDIDLRSTREILRLINDEDRQVIDAVAAELEHIAAAVDAIHVQM